MSKLSSKVHNGKYLIFLFTPIKSNNQIRSNNFFKIFIEFRHEFIYLFVENDLNYNGLVQNHNYSFVINNLWAFDEKYQLDTYLKFLGNEF